jgi:hypothetical protein
MHAQLGGAGRTKFVAPSWERVSALRAQPLPSRRHAKKMYSRVLMLIHCERVICMQVWLVPVAVMGPRTVAVHNRACLFPGRSPHNPSVWASENASEAVDTGRMHPTHAALSAGAAAAAHAAHASCGKMQAADSDSTSASAGLGRCVATGTDAQDSVPAVESSHSELRCEAAVQRSWVHDLGLWQRHALCQVRLLLPVWYLLRLDHQSGTERDNEMPEEGDR